MAARRFANAVLDSFGVASQIRCGMHEGFQNARRSFPFDNNAIRRSSAFRESSDQGAVLGRNEGYTSGAKIGEQRGRQAGETAAVQRFRSAVGIGVVDRSVFTPSTPMFDGLTSQKSNQTEHYCWQKLV
jgi:hypothetical protein